MDRSRPTGRGRLLVYVVSGGGVMRRVRVLVIWNGRVARDGVASILNSAESLEVVGREGADVLKEAAKLQPDLIIYDISPDEEEEMKSLKNVKELCSWTKIIIYSSYPIKKDPLRRFLGICDGYLQGPLLPGFLLKAIELACYSGYFFFLGSSKDIKPEFKADVQNLLPLKIPGSSQSTTS